MKIPFRVTIKTPAVTSSFTIQANVVAIPSANDIVIYEFPQERLQPIPCRVLYVSHYAEPHDHSPACLVILDRILLNEEERYLNVINAFATNYSLTSDQIDHKTEEDNILYNKMCYLLGLDIKQELYLFDSDFSKLIAETFRALLIAEQFCGGPIEEDKINLADTTNIVLALHNAILDDKGREDGKHFNLRRAIMKFDIAVNPDKAYSWTADIDQVNQVRDIISSNRLA